MIRFKSIITANRTSLPEAIFALISRLDTALGIPRGEEELGQVVNKHAWETFPRSRKGGANSTARPSRADGGRTSPPIRQGASRR
jgi:hypothetical protein